MEGNVLRFFLLFAYVLLSCFGIYFIKTCGSADSISLWFGLVMYFGGSMVWLALLRLLPLSIAFPLASGAMMVGTTAIGFFLLHEVIGISQIIGSITIVIGAWMVQDKVVTS